MTNSDAAPTPEHWLGQEGIRWNIMLVASLAHVPDLEELAVNLAALSREQGWPEPPPDAVGEGAVASLLQQYAAAPDSAHPLSVGRTPGGLVVRAHHAYVDGLGLLAALAHLTGRPVRSGARGVGVRPHRGALPTLAGRLVEVAVRPPAPVQGTGTTPGQDVFAAATVDRGVRTADLVYAGARAVDRWNRGHGTRANRIAVAVGVSTTGGEVLEVGDHSGFLRLTGIERLDREQVDAALAIGPLQLGGTASTGTARRARGLIRWASTTLADRLGSTLLVSHLGRVEADGLTDAAFHPLSGAGSGVSLGAVTVGGRTTLTMRARGEGHSTDDLEAILRAVVDVL